MSGSARVTSLAALRDFKAAIQQFIEEASAALTEVDADALRTSQWLRFDQTAHWQGQARQRHEAVEASKSELRRKQFSGLEDNPTAIEYRRAVDRAKRREEEALEKVQRVRRWLPTIDREITLYKGAIQPLSDVLSRDLPAAMVRLDRMAAAIEGYASIAMTPSGGVAPVASGAAEYVAPPVLTPEEAGAVHAPLRRRSPRQGLRDGLRVSKPVLPARPDQTIEGPEDGILSHLGLGPDAPPADSKITFEEGALESAAFYLERGATPPSGDSGWHIGAAGPFASGERPIEAATVGSLLSLRPALGRLLELPPGYLVLCVGGSDSGSGGGGGGASPVIEAVLDPQDRRVYP